MVGDFGDAIDAEFGLLKRLALRSGRPVTFTLLQTHRYPEQWRDLLERTAAANADGAEITGQIRGRPTSTLLGFELSHNPFLGLRQLAGFGGAGDAGACRGAARPGLAGSPDRRGGR